MRDVAILHRLEVLPCLAIDCSLCNNVLRDDGCMVLSAALKHMALQSLKCVLSLFTRIYVTTQSCQQQDWG